VRYTRVIVTAIHDGSLAASPTQLDPIFGLAQVIKCPEVPDEILIPENSWKDPAQYRSAASKLANLFKDNFKQFVQQVSTGIRTAGPQ
jgi:phosphoenolpyruvate carboxykinase (ATP)